MSSRRDSCFTKSSFEGGEDQVFVARNILSELDQPG